MSFIANCYKVLIASPSDLEEEREVATRAIHEWNDQNTEDRGIVLLPVKWETHSFPEAGGRPQAFINRQLVDGCDLLIGLFWTKLGSDTGVAESGTVEEIDQFVASDRPAMLYTSRRPIDPAKIDQGQHAKLKAFKEKTYKTAIVGSFSSLEDLRDRLIRDLTRRVSTWPAKGAGASTVVFDARRNLKREMLVDRGAQRYDKQGKPISPKGGGRSVLTNEALEILRTNADGVWEVEVRPKGMDFPTVARSSDRHLTVRFDAKALDTERDVRAIVLDLPSYDWIANATFHVTPNDWTTFEARLKAPRDSDLLVRIQDEVATLPPGALHLRKIFVELEP